MSKKFVGPTKKMADALEDEGLHIEWPKTIEDESDLAIEGSFLTGPGWEKTVVIDLRDEGELKTKAEVDEAICRQLEVSWESFDVGDELALHMQGSAYERDARGVPEPDRLVADLYEQDARLERFYNVAEAVVGGYNIPPEKEKENIHLTETDTETVCKFLRRLYQVQCSMPRQLGTRQLGKELDELRRLYVRINDKLPRDNRKEMEG